MEQEEIVCVKKSFQIWIRRSLVSQSWCYKVTCWLLMANEKYKFNHWTFVPQTWLMWHMTWWVHFEDGNAELNQLTNVSNLRIFSSLIYTSFYHSIYIYWFGLTLASGYFGFSMTKLPNHIYKSPRWHLPTPCLSKYQAQNKYFICDDIYKRKAAKLLIWKARDSAIHWIPNFLKKWAEQNLILSGVIKKNNS